MMVGQEYFFVKYFADSASSWQAAAGRDEEHRGAGEALDWLLLNIMDPPLANDRRSGDEEAWLQLRAEPPVNREKKGEISQCCRPRRPSS